MQHLATILEKLTTLLKGALKSTLRDLFIELCLTVPAKFHNMGPYMNLLVKPILFALQGSSELVNIGIKVLEIWLDTLKSDVLEPILEPVMPELIQALLSHLKTQPHAYGSAAIRILAKLGGKNRRYLTDSLSMDTNERTEEGLKVLVSFNNESNNNNNNENNNESNNNVLPKFFELPLDRFIKMAKKVLYSSGELHSREQAFLFIKTSVLAMMNLDGDLPSQFTLVLKIYFN